MKVTIEHKNIVSIEFTGQKVTKEDVRFLENTIEEIHKDYEKVNCIVLVSGTKSATLDAFAESLKFCFKEGGNIRKVAVVSDSKFYRIAVPIENWLVPWEEKYFDIDQIQDAWDWLKI